MSELSWTTAPVARARRTWRSRALTHRNLGPPAHLDLPPPPLLLPLPLNPWCCRRRSCAVNEKLAL